jgi:hypothetical protein
MKLSITLPENVNKSRTSAGRLSLTKFIHVLFFIAGKTLMLILQGLRWLCEGHHVFVLDFISPTAKWPFAEQIVHQLRALMNERNGDASPAVSLYSCDLAKGKDSEVTRAVKKLTKFAEAHGSQLCILMDECGFSRK